MPFLFLESVPLFLRKNALEMSCPSKFEMLPTPLIVESAKYGDKRLVKLFYISMWSNFLNKPPLGCRKLDKPSGGLIELLRYLAFGQPPLHADDDLCCLHEICGPCHSDFVFHQSEKRTGKDWSTCSIYIGIYFAFCIEVV